MEGRASTKSDPRKDRTQGRQAGRQADHPEKAMGRQGIVKICQHAAGPRGGSGSTGRWGVVFFLGGE